MKKAVLIFLVLMSLLILMFSVGSDGGSTALLAQHSSFIADTEIDPANLKMFQPIPAVMASEKNPLTEEKIRLGRMLFYDARLSRDGKISCNDCHDLAQYGVDGKPFSDGFKGQLGSRNAPTVYNAAGHIAQFWDGRAQDVEEQAKGPVLNPVEMAMPNSESVVKVLKSIPGYVEAFKRAFPNEKDPVTYDNFGLAVGAFERKLVTESRWDKYLEGDASALTNVEKIGFNRFLQNNCQMCHSGAYVGGAMFMKLGLVKQWQDSSDLGRYQITKKEADKMVFKVPSLRNVAMTGPYFHKGSAKTLDEAVRDMAEFQVGRTLTNDDVRFIVAWLKTLTGVIPSDYIKPPALPDEGAAASGSGTK